MADDKTKIGEPDRRRVASDQPYEVEDFHQKHGRNQGRSKESGRHAYRCRVFGEGRSISTIGGNSDNRSAQDLISGPSTWLPRAYKGSDS
jgi:hypothetical protein